MRPKRKAPSHRNWRTDRSHRAFWDLWPQLDHVLPVALGGDDDESNLVTCSGVSNMQKLHFTLEELGWNLRDPGNMTEWGGLTAWFLDYVDRNPKAMEAQHPAGAIEPWVKAARRAQADGHLD